MQSAERMAILSAIILVVLSSAYAAFPYNAQWLNYADKRIIYKIDTSTVTNNTADIYVTVSIDPTELQSFIDRWASFCDPNGVYPWFYPTFAYASTANNDERMAQVVEFKGWQTFTVGSCGTVDLPTQFVVKLPNGVLDGGSNFASYSHYLYAYLKYPYTWDFYDAIGPTPPSYISGAGTIGFSTSFGIGHSLSYPSRASFDTSIAIDTSKPAYFCGYVPDPPAMLAFYIDDLSTKVSFSTFPNLVKSSCWDITSAIIGAVGTGTHTIIRVELWDAYGDPNGLYYLWIIPADVYDHIYGR